MKILIMALVCAISGSPSLARAQAMPLDFGGLFGPPTMDSATQQYRSSLQKQRSLFDEFNKLELQVALQGAIPLHKAVFGVSNMTPVQKGNAIFRMVSIIEELQPHTVASAHEPRKSEAYKLLLDLIEDDSGRVLECFNGNATETASADQLRSLRLKAADMLGELAKDHGLYQLDEKRFDKITDRTVKDHAIQSLHEGRRIFELVQRSGFQRDSR